MHEEAEEILKLIDTLQIEHWERFEFRGTEFLILLSPAEFCKEEGGAHYHPSTAINGFDIYVSEQLAGTALKRVLFHEIMEVHLLQSMDQPDAHSVAKRMDEELFG